MRNLRNLMIALLLGAAALLLGRALSPARPGPAVAGEAPAPAPPHNASPAEAVQAPEGFAGQPDPEVARWALRGI